MGYVLLWIEQIVTTLLLVATLVACFSRLQRPWSRLALSLLVALVPLIVYSLLILGLGYLRFNKLILIGVFYPLVALMACYAIGVVWILVAGLRRRRDDSTETVAAAWPRGKLALMMCCAGGLHMMTWWNLDLAAKQQLASLKTEAGTLGLSLAPARVPDRDNAALLYDQTYEALDQQSWSEVYRDKWDQWTDSGAPEVKPGDPELAVFLREQAPALTLLRQAGRKPGCHFGRDYSYLSIDLLLPELAKLRGAARLLALDARYHAAQGDMVTALADVDALFSMVEHVSSDPLLISALVAVAIDAVATATLEDVLSAERNLEDGKRITAGQLQSIHLDGSLSFRRIFSRSLRSELACALNCFHQICTGDHDSLTEILGKGVQPYPLVPPLQSVYRLFMARTDVESYRAMMNELSQMAAKPYFEVREQWDNFENEFSSKPTGLLTAMLLPALPQAAKMGAQGDAQYQTARLALAAARYRAENGDLPKNLDALAPNYIPIPVSYTHLRAHET